AGDLKMAGLSQVKGRGWADERVWKLPEYANMHIQLDRMISQYIEGLANVQNQEELMQKFTQLRYDVADTSRARDVIGQSAWVNGSFYCSQRFPFFLYCW